MNDEDDIHDKRFPRRFIAFFALLLCGFAGAYFWQVSFGVVVEACADRPRVPALELDSDLVVWERKIDQILELYASVSQTDLRGPVQ